jgi:hypothetical protein
MMAAGVALAVAAVVLAACGSSVQSGSIIKGNATYTASAARAIFLTSSEPLTGTTVELVDSSGNVVATTTVDSNGDFTFTGVKEGDYTLVFKDADGAIITQTNVSLLNGDDVTLTGTFNDSTVTWDVTLTSDGSGLNDTQKAILKKIAELSGMTEDEILKMRLDEHKGWGLIALELGLHPGQLGLGHPDGWEPKRKTPATGAGGNTKSGKGNGGGKGKPTTTPGGGSGK